MQRWYTVLFAALLIGNILVFRAIFDAHRFNVTVLNVTKGDATLVHTGEGETILVDTGADASVLRALGTELPFWQRRIDLVILTSTKTSSLGGLPAVTSRYHVVDQVTVGDSAAPYGTRITSGNTVIGIISPGTFTVSDGSNTFSVSSSTLTQL